MRRFLPLALLFLTSCAPPPDLTPRQRLDQAVPYVETSLQVACASLAYLGDLVTEDEAAHLRTACDALRVVVGETLTVARGRLGSEAP